MRGLSLWQPWASAMAINAKGIETRHWSTDYRGPVAIHAAKRRNITELDFIVSDPEWRAALAPLGSTWRNLPFGAIVAVGQLVDCRRTESFEPAFLNAAKRWVAHGDASWCENDMGDFSEGRFGWVFERLIALPKPIPFRGAQGFFHVPDALLREVA